MCKTNPNCKVILSPINTSVVTQKNVTTNVGCNHLQYIIGICNLDHKLLNIFYVGKNIHWLIKEKCHIIPKS
jgi:hypothetical protein